jgi:hypothetical protein
MIKRRGVFSGLLAVAALAVAIAGTPARPAAQAAPAAEGGFRTIQEIRVPDGVRTLGRMKVKQDGSLVVYDALLESVESVVMANTTRLTNTLLAAAKQMREKGGDPKISVDPADYAFTLVHQIEVSPFDDPVFKNGAYAGVNGGWGWAAYYVSTLSGGSFVLINELKAPDFRPVNFAAGGSPSFLHVSGTQKEIAYWAQSGDKIVLAVGREQGAQLTPGDAPYGPALFFRNAPPVGCVYVAGNKAKGAALYLNNQKVSTEYDGIEPALNVKGRSVGYIARKGAKAVLFANGAEQATGFFPAHGLTFFAGGEAFAFAAAQNGREFVVKNGLKSLSTFVRVTKDRDFAHVLDLAINGMATSVAYIASDGKKEWIMVDDRKVTPEFDRVAFNREHYEWGGPVVFAGYDAAKRVIIVGQI